MILLSGGLSLYGFKAESRITRAAFVLLTTVVAVGFGLAVTTSSLVAIGVTLLITVLVVVGSAMSLSPLRGACLLLGMCIVLVDGNFRVNVTGQIDFDYQIIGKLSLYAMSLLYALLFIQRSAVSLLNGLALLYTLALTLTAIYAVEPLVALGGAFILWSQVLLSFAIGTRTTTTEALEQVWRAVFYSVFVKIAACWVLFLVNPSAALLNDDPMVHRINEFSFPRFAGYLGPNGIGFSAALLATLSLVSWLNAIRRRDRIMAGLVSFLSAVSVVCSQSRTGLAALLVGVLVVTAFQHRRLFYVTVLASTVLTGYLFFYHGDRLLGYATRGRSLDSLSSLEGRTGIWSALGREILEAPILGYGYGSARTIVPQLQTGNVFQALYAAHNMFYESMLNGGIAVTMLLVIMIVRAAFLSLRHLMRRPPGIERYVVQLRAFATLAILFTNGMAESGICGVQTSQALLFFLVLATISADQRLSDSAPESGGESQRPTAAIAIE